jgi:hypothetical protein
MGEQLTLFSADFHVSDCPSAWRVTKKDGTMTDTFGLNFRGWSEKLDRVGSSLKTYLESCELPLTTFARTWSVSATASGFGVLRLRLSERATGECWCFFLPTPRAADGNKGTRTLEGAQREETRGHGIDLPMFAQLYPTPRPCSGKRSGGSNRSEFYRLFRIAHLFPTPTCNDAKNDNPPSQRTENGRHSDQLSVVAGGSLNPDWVEWLMGFPPGWTELDGGGTNTTSPESPEA